MRKKDRREIDAKVHEEERHLRYKNAQRWRGKTTEKDPEICLGRNMKT